MSPTLIPEELHGPEVGVWEKYRQQERNNGTRVQEHRARTLFYRGKIMKYYSITKGEKPHGGYPLYIALHGGGGLPVEVNDGGWEKMQKKYLQSIKQGVYVAPRGITDTWDLHFRPESYVFYDRLIENMILFEDINSDRVYLLGYSAGGDGVYQIAPRMADRFAAVNMSAGHHNFVDCQNLASLPIALQAGQHDDEFNRNFETAKLNDILDSLAKENRGQYIHTTWIHADKGHRFIDNDPDETPQAVLDDPHKWLSFGANESSNQNTNAVCWLSQFVRNPRPRRVIWDLKTHADRQAEEIWNFGGHGQQFYWIDIGNNDLATLGVDTIIVELNQEDNMIRVERFGNYLRLLVDRNMLDFEQPVKILVGGQIETVRVYPSEDIQWESLKQRGDPCYIFDSSITIIQTQQGIHITSP